MASPARELIFAVANRLVIVAAGDLLAKGYVAIPADRRAPDGAVVNALYGVARSVTRVLATRRPGRAVALLGPAPHVVPKELAEQRRRLPAILESLGLPTFDVSCETDAVAAYVAAGKSLGDDVTVLGSDKRFAQLVAAGVWWHDAYKDVRYTPEMVFKRFGVRPELVADWLALVGDADALPGIKGIGKKGATGLLERFGSVGAALEHTDELDTRTRNALQAAGDSARAAVVEATLDPTAPLPASLDRLELGPTSDASVNAMYNDLGFYELLAVDDEPAADVAICTTEPAVIEALRRLGTEPAAVHGLTESPSPVRGELAGLAVVSAADVRSYFPVVAQQALSPALVAWLEDATKPKVGHETATLVAALARRGVRLEGVVGDSACASHLFEPSNFAPHELPDLARLLLQRALPPDDDVLGVGLRRRTWASVAATKAAGHAATYAATAGAVLRSLRPRVDPELHAEYLGLSETVAGMAARGIGVDGDELARVGDDFEARASSLELEVFEHAGRRFNLASAKQLGTVLFEDLGLTVVRRTKTGWSTATEALLRIQHEHPIVSLVVRWRALQRMRSTWITSLKGCIDVDGRVRSTFHPARSFSGRLVNSSPDLGRVPGKTDEMQRIRRAFVAAPGKVLLSVDYRQLGLYVLAHLTEDPALVDPLSRGDDMHVLTAAAVLEVSADEVTPDQRQLGKVVNFATFAGQGASALSQQLAVSPAEAKRLIERFDRRYSVVRAFQDQQLWLARERGYILTVAGRRWPIGALQSKDPHDLSYAERLARRATHEGSVADVSRRGLLHADRALRAADIPAAPLLQIHDEVLFEVDVAAVTSAATVVAEAMTGAFDLRVPLRVGCKTGPNWADMEPVAVARPTTD